MITNLENLWIDLECAINNETGIEEIKAAITAAIRADERRVVAESLTTRDGFIGLGTQCRFCERQLYTHNKLDNPYGVVCFHPDLCPIRKAVAG